MTEPQEMTRERFVGAAEALFSLKENLRVSLLLRYMEGDTGEIAAALGLPVSLVKKQAVSRPAGAAKKNSGKQGGGARMGNQ